MKSEYKTKQYVLAAVVILLNSLLIFFDSQSVPYNSILTIDGIFILYYFIVCMPKYKQVKTLIKTRHYGQLLFIASFIAVVILIGIYGIGIPSVARNLYAFWTGMLSWADERMSK